MFLYWYDSILVLELLSSFWCDITYCLVVMWDSFSIFQQMQAESAIAALNCSGVVLGSLPIRLVFVSIGWSKFGTLLGFFM